MDKTMNAEKVLANINACIAELEAANKDHDKFDRRRMVFGRWDSRHRRYAHAFKIDAVYDELSIFDWWPERLSMSRLKEMKSFVETAISLGFTGYVCFKVGSAGCSHGMWAAKKESTDGYSPDGATLFKSFRPGDWYWSACDDDGKWMGDGTDKYAFTLDEVKKFIA